MATRREFCNEMNNVYKNHGVYIGAANGERTESLTFERVRKLEESYEGRDHKSDIQRDLTYIGNCYGKGWSMELSYAGDCSGQIVGAMRRLDIHQSDMRARDFQDASRPVELDALTTGDLVFDKKLAYDEKKKKYYSVATHVGVYDNGYVVESKGRDAGVVRRKLSEGSWVIGGRLDWFEDSVPVLTRDLKYVKGDLMKGDDVMECQERLHAWGYLDDYHGKYGKETKKAVTEFQQDRNITADEPGVVGQVTWAKLYEV